MMNHLLLFTTIFLLLLSYISCVSLPPAYKLGCIILPKNQKIYCYGGATKQPNAPSSAIFKDDKFYNDLYSLDVSKPLNINGSNTQWELIPPPNDFVHEGRADFAMVAYNDTAFLISSGNGPTSDFKNPGLVNVTVRYNTEFNSWKAVKALDPLSPKMNISLDTQMFGSRAAQVNGTFLFFSGGNSPDNNTVVQTDSQLVTYKAESPTWETVLVTTIVIRPGGVISPFT
ncbi:hypothetical protein BJ944DRAFT_127649 [Cunninghamella echinulata]|nr:hypothetical protein BJ944DRAFT_127649 [Cunninghamella echinulata]